MLDLINFAAFLWLTMWLSLVIWKLIQGSRELILFVMIAFYIICALPLLLDVLYLKPEYRMFPGFRIATHDNMTGIVYCAYVSIIPVIWWFTARPRSAAKSAAGVPEEQDALLQTIRKFKWLLYMGMVSPLLLIVFAPNPFVYASYGAALGDGATEEMVAYYFYVVIASLLSVVSAGVLLLLKERLYFSNFLFYVPWMALSIWVNGKRLIVVLAALLIGYLLLEKKIIKGWGLIYAALLGAILMGAFSYAYQNTLRSEEVTTGSGSVYENVRLDFGRDETIKFTIYSELNADRFQILEYRGQSVLFNVLQWVPRAYWESKPWPYSVYFTSALWNIRPAQYLGWGMTTSWLEEAIANFGWFGMLLGPLGISWICRIGEREQSGITRALTILIASMFITVQLAAFFSLFLIWVALIMYGIFIRLLKKRPAAQTPLEAR